MSYVSIVLAKQVPDTANISGEVMRPDGTVNRGRLPAIFNPEDKVALELALQFRERYGGRVIVISMGPPKASDLLRECLYMGADETILISDRKFAGADTLATSYVLSETISKLGKFDLIFAGRQAIDGDTAQVGPQTAEKLKIPQITYAEAIIDVKNGKITVKRRIDGGYEVLSSSLPLLLTVIKDAATPRPFQAKRVMSHKNAKTLLELERTAEANSLLIVDDLQDEYTANDLFIKTMTMDDLQLEAERCGIAGSPTKVHKVESVVLSGGDHEKIEASKDGMNYLVQKLMDNHILG